MKVRMPKLPGGIGNLQELAKQAQQLQSKMDEATKNLSEKEYSATSGGEAVSVTVTGKMEIKHISIKPEVIDPEDSEMLSDLIIAAANEALRSASTDKQETLDKISGSMNMPGLF